MGKRKNRGRSKGNKGHSSTVQCASCGRQVPVDKAKRVTRPVVMVEVRLAQELRKKGAYIPRTFATRYFCISCSTHRGIVHPRSKTERRKEDKEEQNKRERRKVDIQGKLLEIGDDGKVIY
jgi:small subunit ribosomal protein S26e